jgi:hypothetical protein
MIIDNKYKVGRTLVPMLWLSSADKAEEPKVQGKVQVKDEEQDRATSFTNLT